MAVKAGMAFTVGLRLFYLFIPLVRPLFRGRRGGVQAGYREQGEGGLSPACTHPCLAWHAVHHRA